MKIIKNRKFQKIYFSDFFMQNFAEKPLLILDIDNILATRVPLINKSGAHTYTAIQKRKGLDKFLEMIFNHFTVSIWSLTSQYELQQLLSIVLGDFAKHLLFIWGKNRCIYSQVNGVNAYLKPLSVVWKEYPQYSINNTLIIDWERLAMITNPNECVLHVNKYEINNDLNLNHGLMREIAHYILVPSCRMSLQAVY